MFCKICDGRIIYRVGFPWRLAVPYWHIHGLFEAWGRPFVELPFCRPRWLHYLQDTELWFVGKSAISFHFPEVFRTRNSSFIGFIQAVSLSRVSTHRRFPLDLDCQRLQRCGYSEFHECTWNVLGIPTVN